eukprot:GILJ01000383.1.p1 GENE.GILJ01000383.1~~GILJ01000383.1.p1  ORF type:complete len:494 (+),score=88.68 GILJ01000383.1:102-1484(+)
MALNTHVTFTSSGKRSLRSVVAHRLSTANPMEKVQQSFSTWRIGMNLASVCRENCDELIEDVKSQGEAFLNEAMLIDTITDPEPFLDGIESVISSSFERSGLPVPETLRASLDSIQKDGYSSPPLTHIFEEQLNHVWARFEKSELYQSMESVAPSEAIKAIQSLDPSVSSTDDRAKPDGRTLHNLLRQLVSERIAPLDEMEESFTSEDVETVTPQVDPLDAGPSSGTPSSPSEYSELQDQMSMVTPEHVDSHSQQKLEKLEKKEKMHHKKQVEMLDQDGETYSLQQGSVGELLLLQVESKHGAAFAAILLLHSMNEMLIWFMNHSGPYGLYGIVALILFAKVMHVLFGASETAIVVPEHDDEVVAEVEFAAPVADEQQDEEEEDEATKDAPHCSVCWAKPVSVYSPTCRHYAMCSECAKKLTHCPICRAPLGENLMQSLPWFKYKEIQSLYVNGKEDADL